MERYQIRPLDPQSEPEVALVAQRMRATLVEVLGEERGAAMYTMNWLENRVRWHLDSSKCTGEVFVAEAPDGDIVGHTIVRIDADERGEPIGLFSTTYVEPTERRGGAARQLLARGEAWMTERGLAVAITYTDTANTKLQNLYYGLGYTLTPMPNNFVKLWKQL